jgi:hypothetical protein
MEGMPSLLELSRGLGVRYLVVHPQDYPDPALGRSHLEAITAAPGQWRDRVHFGDATAFVLEPFQTQPLPTGRAVPPARITAQAYTAPDRVGALFDGLLYSRWTSGPQSGGEWIELRFSTPIDVAGLHFDVHGRSLPHYPQQLTITADPAGAQTVLFSGSILSGLGQSLVRDPTRPQYSIVLPPNRATVLRIAQTARAVREPFWAIDELVVLERE